MTATVLETELMRIMDFPNDLSKAYHEAQSNNKLRNTYMVVNGELAYIKDFDIAKNNIIGGNKLTDGTKLIPVKSLEVWLPEIGIYNVPNNPTFLFRFAQKQWRKSFSWDFYAVKSIGTSLTYSNDPYALFKQEPEKIALLNNKIYFYTTLVAELVQVEDGVLIFKYVDTTFAEEVNDYIRERGKPWILT
jgi:hypothetical protein